MINAEVTKTGAENALSTIRKFTRRVQGAGLVKTVRAQRYYSRASSKTVSKKRALKLIKRHDEYRKAIKEGKITEAPPKHQGYRREQPVTATSTGSGKLGEDTPIAR